MLARPDHCPRGSLQNLNKISNESGEHYQWQTGLKQRNKDQQPEDFKIQTVVIHVIGIKESDRELLPKHREMTHQKLCVIHIISITVEGKYKCCLESLLMSLIVTLSTRRKFLSFSSSDALINIVLGQKKILTPEGSSGRIQKNNQYPKGLK